MRKLWKYFQRTWLFFRHLLLSFVGTRSVRYSARHKVLSMLAKLAGLRMYNLSLYWFHDQDYLHMWRQFPEANNSILDRKFTLFQLVKSISDLAGDTAECGTLYGGSSHIILSATEKNPTAHHIFDSFEGLSAPEKEDAVTAVTPYVWKKHDLSVPEARVAHNLAPFESRCHYHKGWIPDRFNDVAHKKFKLTHIDVDLYQPTLDSLRFFYERTVTGGLLICDDYGFETCPGAKQAFDEFMADKPETIIHLTTGQAVVIKR